MKYLILLFSFFAFLIPTIASAASPSIVGTPVTNSGTVVGALTTSITVPSTGQNECLIVIPICSSGNSGCFSGTGGSVLYGVTSMTQIVNVTGAVNNGGMMYYLAAPASGTNNIVMTVETIANPTDVAMTAFVLQDCVQSSPVDATGPDTSGVTGTSAAPSVTTTIDNDLVIGWLSNRTGTSLTTSQTFVTGNPFDPAGSNFSQFGASYIPLTTHGMQAINFSWTGSDHYEAFVTSIKYIAPTPVIAKGFGYFNSFWW